jgi:hypothetical protein
MLRASLLPMLMLVMSVNTFGCSPTGSFPVGNDQDCARDALCLKVRLDGAALPGSRLLVVWATPGVEGPEQVAYQVPFTGQERALRIPFDRIALPTNAARYPALRCDGIGSPCGVNAVATAYIVVVAAPAEGTSNLKGRLLGASPAMLGFAEHEIAKGERSLSDVFPGGMREGIGSYTPSKPVGHLFDQLWPAAPGAVFDLVVCGPDGSGKCEPPVPNIT